MGVWFGEKVRNTPSGRIHKRGMRRLCRVTSRSQTFWQSTSAEGSRFRLRPVNLRCVLGMLSEPVPCSIAPQVSPLSGSTLYLDHKQWKTFWEDIMVFYPANEAGDKGTHFMGAVVTMPARSVPVGVSKFLSTVRTIRDSASANSRIARSLQPGQSVRTQRTSWPSARSASTTGFGKFSSASLRRDASAGMLAGISQARQNILASQARIVFHPVRFRLTCGEQFEDKLDRKTCAANDRFPSHDLGVDDDQIRLSQQFAPYFTNSAKTAFRNNPGGSNP